MDTAFEASNVHFQRSLMARSKDDDAAWETHRHELKAMFLDQRLTVEQIRQHMSQKYNFSKRLVISTWKINKRLTQFPANINTTDSLKSGTLKRTLLTMTGALLHIVARKENEKGKILVLWA